MQHVSPDFVDDDSITDVPTHVTRRVRAEVLPKLGAAPERILPAERLCEELAAWFASLHQRTGGWIMVCYDYFVDFALLREALACDIPGWMTYDNVDRKVPHELRTAYWPAHPDALPHHALHDARALCAAYRQAQQQNPNAW